MTVRVIVLTTILFAGGVVVSAALARHSREAACITNQGSVLGHSDHAFRSCPGGVIAAAPLFGTETLHTDTTGTFTFHTTAYFECRESASSADVLTPSPLAAITHLRGTTWCKHNQGDAAKYLQVVRPRAVVRPNGTLIGLTLDDKGLLVQLADGSATVTAGAPARRVVVKAGSQLLIPFTGVPSSPTPLVLTQDQQVASTELRFDVVELGGPPQVSEQLNVQGSKAAVLIADTPSTLKRARAALAQASVQTDGLTVAQVNKNPSIVSAELKRLGTHTIVTAGAFAVTSPVWPTLRSAAKLSSETSVDYMPF